MGGKVVKLRLKKKKKKTFGFEICANGTYGSPEGKVLSNYLNKEQVQIE